MVKKVVTKTVTKTEQGEDGTVKETVKQEGPTVVESKPKAPPVKKKLSAAEREEMLIQNFVGLQHAMTNLSIKFGTLSDNISELLRVFEGAARSFSKGDKVDDTEMLKKIDNLLDQNKTIAKGLVLMEGKLRARHHDEAGYHGFHRPEPLSPMSHGGMRPSIASGDRNLLEVGQPGMHPSDQMSQTGESDQFERAKPKPLPRL